MLLPQNRRIAFILLCFCWVTFSANAQNNEVGSISGQLLMLDDKTPHVAVVVQVVLPSDDQDEPVVVATTLSNDSGRFQFSNLEPRWYLLRCYTLDGYVYYRRQSALELIEATNDQRTTTNRADSARGDLLPLKRGMSLENIDFRFAAFKKGKWRNFTYLDGLAHDRIYRTRWDAEGMMWLETVGGLSRYDGKKFVNFIVQDRLANNSGNLRPDSAGVLWWFASTRGWGIWRVEGEEFVTLSTKDGLVSNDIISIYRDAVGILWFGTRVGVSRYDGKGFVNFTTKDGLAPGRVYSMHEGPNGVMWFGTLGGGVSRYDGKEFVTFTTEDGLANDYVRFIDQDTTSMLWFGTSNGLSRYDGKEFVTFTAKDGLGHNRVRALHQDVDGRIWVATGENVGEDGGVSYYDGKGFVTFTAKDGLGHSEAHTIYSDPDGVMWFGTIAGVSRYDGKGFINFTIEDGLAANWVYNSRRDADGLMWFSTGAGVSRYDEKGFVNFTTKDGLGDNYVHTIYQDADGAMWFGTKGGVSRYDGKIFVTFTTAEGLPSNDVVAIHQASDNAMWFGTYGGGVSRYNGERFVNFTTEDGLVDNAVNAIMSDRDGVLWFGCEGPNLICCYDGVAFSTIGNEGGVNAIHRDAAGTLWFGNGWYHRVGGVLRYDGAEFTKFTIEDGLAHYVVHSLYGDSDGSMWFGTAGGVSRYDGKTWMTFTKEDGLADNDVKAVYHDTDGILWCGTTGGGVSGYDGVAWTSLDTRDGLAGNKVKAIHQDASGNLWFGTSGGVTRYRRNTTTKPKIQIASVTIDKVYSDLSALPKFTTKNRLTIAYNAIDFKTIPEKRQCRYRTLRGEPVSPRHKDDWQPFTKESTFDVVFDKPNVYTIEVQAVDRDLNYSKPDRVTLNVVAPFYMRAGFLVPTIGSSVIMAVILVIVLMGYIKRRRQVLAYQQLAVEELADARRVQMGLMPEIAPKVEGLEIAGRCVSATEVSGDFFDYLLERDNTQIAIAVGDVTGHGMQGAMNAVMTDGMLHTIRGEATTLSPHTLMTKLNTALAPRIESGMNVTMVIGLVNAENFTLTLANAGHHAHPQLLQEGLVKPLVAKGMPLGMMAGIPYREVEFQLQSGDVLVFMTDGIIEAKDSTGQEYQETDRLRHVLAQFTSDTSAEAMVSALIDDATTFGADMTPEEEDDITVVVVKVL